MAVGLVWLVSQFLGASPAPFATVPYGETVHEDLERLAAEVTGTESRRTGGAPVACTLPNGVAGEEREVGASARLGPDQSQEDALEAVRLAWAEGRGLATIEPGSVQSQDGIVSAVADGRVLEANVDGDELELRGLAVCMPLRSVEPSPY